MLAAAALFDGAKVGIESARSDDRSITCLGGTVMRKLVVVAVAVGFVVAAVAEDYMGVVDIAAKVGTV
jgi:hypothetical protein